MLFTKITFPATLILHFLSGQSLIPMVSILLFLLTRNYYFNINDENWAFNFLKHTRPPPVFVIFFWQIVPAHTTLPKQKIQISLCPVHTWLINQSSHVGFYFLTVLPFVPSSPFLLPLIVLQTELCPPRILMFKCYPAPENITILEIGPIKR